MLEQLHISRFDSPRQSEAVIVDDPRAKGLPIEGVQLECLGTGTTWSEGPVWMFEDQSLLFSDIPANRMMRWSEQDGLTVWRERVDFTNGHAREFDGALLHCSHGERAIVRTRFGPGSVAGAGGPKAQRDCTDEIVVSHYQGKRLNSPNDIVVKSDGTLWFTDPPYGICSNREGYQAACEQSANNVFRFDPAASADSAGALSVVSNYLVEPNGLAFSPDEKILYVSDTSAASDVNGHHHIVAFDVVGGSILKNPRIFAVIDPGLADGFRIDSNGWLYTSSAESVQVFHPDGTRIARIPVPEKIGNLTFGGPLRDQLFIVASTSLYRIRLNTNGAQKL